MPHEATPIIRVFFRGCATTSDFDVCTVCIANGGWRVVFTSIIFFPWSNDPICTQYDNLLYCCSSCNLRKLDANVADPCHTLLRSTVTVQPDGSIRGETPEAIATIDHLGLNDQHYIGFRRVWMRIVEIVAASRPQSLAEILGYPDDLPDLSKLRPPGGNAKP